MQQPQQQQPQYYPQQQYVPQQQHQPFATQQQPTIVVQTQNQANVSSGCGKREGYAGTASVWLGSIQVTGGLLAIIFQIVLIVIVGTAHESAGVGIWCGLLFLIPGGFGIGAGMTKSLCQIITYMVLCIIMSIICTISMLPYTAVGIDYCANTWKYTSNDYIIPGYSDYIDKAHDYVSDVYDSHDPKFSPVLHDYAVPLQQDLVPERTSNSGANYRHPFSIYEEQKVPILSLYSLLLIVCIVELITMIIGSALCCKAACCGGGARGGEQSGQVIMPPGQVMTIIQHPAAGQAYQPASGPSANSQPVMPPSYTSSTQASSVAPTDQESKIGPPIYDRPPAYVPPSAVTSDYKPAVNN